MDLFLFLKKVYWHFFKVMPGEMTLKTFWDKYYIVERLPLNGTYNLADLRTAKNLVGGKNLFVYWDKGFEQAPPIVQKCLESVKCNIPEGWSLFILSEANIKDFIHMPDFIERRTQSGEICRAHYADILRTALLFHYGGLWLDATCFLTKPIPDVILKSSLFMFSYTEIRRATPFVFENYFIRAEKGNYLMGRLLEILLHYFKTCKTPRAIYFIYYYLTAVLYRHDSEAHLLMDNIPWWSNQDTLFMQIIHGLNKVCSDSQWQYMRDKCFVHKLIYRYDKSLNECQGTIPFRILHEYFK